jgi:hypothetical protein
MSSRSVDRSNNITTGYTITIGALTGTQRACPFASGVNWLRNARPFSVSSSVASDRVKRVNESAVGTHAPKMFAATVVVCDRFIRELTRGTTVPSAFTTSQP